MSVAKRKNAGRGLPNIKSQPDELILIKEFTTSDSEYSLSVDDKAYVDFPIGVAKGLAYRNGFKAVGIAVGVLPVLLDGTTKQWGSLKPEFFPDAFIFDGAGIAPALSEKQALNGLWMGHMTVQSNEGVRIDKHPLISFMHVPHTQSAAALQSMHTGAEVKSLGGVLEFSGGDDNFINIKINCIDKTLLVGTATRKNYLYVRLVGAASKGDTTARIQK